MDQIRVLEGRPDATGLRFGVAAARFNDAVVERLVSGATGALLRHGALATDIDVAWTPGAFELPLIVARMAGSGRYDAIVAVGAVVRGATPHFDYVAGEASRGCAAVARDTGVPVGFGLLTTDTWDQAVDRAGGKLGNKGAEAALAAVETATLLKEL